MKFINNRIPIECYKYKDSDILLDLQYIVKNSKEGITRNLANNYIEHINTY